MKPLGQKKQRVIAGHQGCAVCQPETKSGKALERRRSEREVREQRMESHRDCCEYRNPDERCGAFSGTKKHICTRKPGHDGRHYDAVECVQWEVAR